MPRTPNPKPRRNVAPKPVDKPKLVQRKGWGGVARKGATTMLSPEDAGRKRRDEAAPEFARTESASWVREPDLSTEDVPTPKRRPKKTAPFIADEVRDELRVAGGRQGERLLRYFSKAAEAYAADRFGDAKHELKVCLDIAPDAPAVQELHGMILYRQGRWQPAAKALRSAHLSTQRFELYPALMDAERASGHEAEVERLWDELRRASPSAEVMAEGRIVYASHLADLERFEEAIRLLEKAPRAKGEPELHHLRTMYVLADCYERSGDIVKARMLFEILIRHDAEFADAAYRLRTLS